MSLISSRRTLVVFENSEMILEVQTSQESETYAGDIYLAMIRVFTVLPVVFLRWTSLYMAVVMATTLTLFILIVVPSLPGMSSGSPRFRSMVSYPMTVLFSIALFGKLGGMLHVAGAVWCLLAVADGGGQLVFLFTERMKKYPLNEIQRTRLTMGAHLSLGAVSAMMAVYWISPGGISKIEHVLVIIPAAIVYTYISFRKNDGIEKELIIPLLAGLLLYILYLFNYSILAENLAVKGFSWIGWLFFTALLWISLGRKLLIDGRSILFHTFCSGCAGYFGSWRLFALFLIFGVLSEYYFLRFWKDRQVPPEDKLDPAKDEDSRMVVLSNVGFQNKQIMEYNLRIPCIVAVVCAFLSLSTGNHVLGSADSAIPAKHYIFQFATVLAIAAGVSRITGKLSAGFLGQTKFSITELKIVGSRSSGLERGIVVLEEHGGSVVGAVIIAIIAALIGLISGFGEFILIPFSILFLKLGMIYTDIISPLPTAREGMIEITGIMVLGIVIRMTL